MEQELASGVGHGEEQGPAPCRAAEADSASASAQFDHPIFRESVRRIREWLGATGVAGVEQELIERVVHSGGDLSLASDLRFALAGGCWGMEGIGRPGPATESWGPILAALAGGAPILTDTAMAAAAVVPMARRCFANPVYSVLTWAPLQAAPGDTRSAAGMLRALALHPGAVVLIGSAPTALEALLDRTAATGEAPLLVVGMPVGFVGVAESKRRLAGSGLPHVRLEGSRGGAALAAAAVNALLRHAWLNRPALGG